MNSFTGNGNKLFSTTTGPNTNSAGVTPTNSSGHLATLTYGTLKNRFLSGNPTTNVNSTNTNTNTTQQQIGNTNYVTNNGYSSTKPNSAGIINTNLNSNTNNTTNLNGSGTARSSSKLFGR